MKTKISVMSKCFRNGILFIFITFVVLFSAVIGRLFSLQVVSIEELQSKAR